MNRKELETQLKTKKSELEKMSNQVRTSNERGEVVALGETMLKLRDEINELETQLKELNGSNDSTDGAEPTDARNTKFNTSAIYGGGSFAQNGGSFQNATSKNGALQRNESFLNRCDFERKNLNFGKYIRGLALGNWNGAEHERDAVNTSALGAVIPIEISGQIIDYAREKSLFASSGVKFYPMNSNTMQIGRVANEPTFSFKAEGEEGTQTDFELETVELKSKTAYGYCYVSLEAIKSAENLEGILYDSFSKAIANAIDKGILNGQTNDEDGVAPTGILNDVNINTITAENLAFDDYIKAIGAVRKNNGEPTVLAVNAQTDEFMTTLKDDNGLYLQAPQTLTNLNKIITNQLPHDDTNGDTALIFDPNSIVIGIHNDVIVRMITDSDYCLKNGVVGFQIYAMIDGVAVQPKHIAKITGLNVVSGTNIVI